MTARAVRASAATAVVAAIAAAVTAPGLAGQGTAVAPTQELVKLITAHEVFSAPSGRAGSMLAASRPVTGVQTVLPFLGRTNRAGVRWLRVLLPGRPNGSAGWIRQQGTVPVSTSWHLVISTSARRVLVYRRGHLLRSFAAVVGKPSTPTPSGRFFVEESVRMPRGSPGAPFALALSARSNVLQEYRGGAGQIALHGVANLGGTPGTAVSHGCIRLADPDIRWLAARIAPGVPVSIRA
jgi:lipoprotein-anchoring transpeptidase ErfK/SrfK